MLDLSHIPNSQQDVQIFYASEGARAYQTWRKPKKCNFVYILSIDGGAGGSSGFRMSAPSQSIPGSSAGGSGSVTRALINAGFVPDILYIKVGKGGAGAERATTGNGTSNSGSPGEGSGVFVLPIGSSQVSGSQASSYLGGSVVATPNAGAGTSQLGNNFLLGLTNIISLAGQYASQFAGAFFPGNINPLTSQIVTSGLQGGGMDSSANPAPGGGINASAVSPLISGGTAGFIGGNGENGYTSWKPFFSTGGAGGGASNTAGGQGGDGGAGGIGSGGGSGGSSGGGIAGAGGKGGDGIVIIVSF